MVRATLCALALSGVLAAPTEDLVTSLPGFGAMPPSKLYSGYLQVPGPINGYDSLTVHYMFHESSRDPTTDPLVTWHQGGPGGNSLYGLFGEMGYFQVDANGTHTNPFSWNTVSNMLYMDSPAGSNDPLGFSYCTKGGQRAASCSWNDTSQAEAYAHTLVAFLKKFPEYKSHDLFLTGESYAGQYLPNIATYILNSPFKQQLNLKGIMVGNGCWGGTANSVECNGPNAEQNDIDMYYGKGLISKKLYENVYSVCPFPKTESQACTTALGEASDSVGPHNIYNIYDNCPNTAELLERTGQSMWWLKKKMRAQLDNGVNRTSSSVADSHRHMQHYLGDEQVEVNGGGYEWGCDGIHALGSWMEVADVQKALHIQQPFAGNFNYKTSGPASQLLYPNLVKEIRVMIYNGDADNCVPYKGNEEWTTDLAAKGTVKENKAWHPWFVKDDTSKGSVPAGYATTYTVPGTALDFSFVTIRLAGHMVPAFQPAASLEFFSRFLAGDSM